MLKYGTDYEMHRELTKAEVAQAVTTTGDQQPLWLRLEDGHFEAMLTPMQTKDEAAHFHEASLRF